MANDYLDLPDPDDKKPGTGTGIVPGAPAATAAPAASATAPAAAAPVAPQAPPAPQSANDIILQHLGQGGIGSDRVAAPPRQDSWWDIVPGTKYYNEPAQPGPQSNWDWLTKKYRPSLGDVGTVYGDAWSYGLSPLALQGGQALEHGVQSATGHPYDPLAAAGTPEALRNRITTAYENAGPWGPLIAGAGVATQPLTYVGLGPLARGVSSVAAPVAERVLPQAIAKLAPAAVEGGTVSGTLAATHTAGQGGSLEDYLRNVGMAIPSGMLIGGGTAALPLGRSTPEDVINKTAQASQTANEALSNIKIPSKDLGFKIEGQTDPSVLDVQGYKDWLQSQGVKDVGAGPPLKAAKANANAAGPTHLYDEGDEGYRQWLKNQSVRNIAYAPETNLPTAQQRMMDSINEQLSNPTAAGPLAAAQTADAQAQWAQALRDMKSNVGLPGAHGDVRGQAATASQNFPAGSPENTALQNIARVQDPTGKVVPPWVRRVLVGGGGAAGEVSGYPGGGAAGANIGSEMSNFADWYFKPKGVSPLIEQQINKAYRPMTGQPAPGPGWNQTVGNALLRIYGGGFQ